MVGSFGFDYSFYLFSFVYKQDVPLVELIYPVFTRMPGERYCRPHRPLSVCDVFRGLHNSLVCTFIIYIFLGLFIVVVSFSLLFLGCCLFLFVCLFFFFLFSFVWLLVCLFESLF